MTNYVMTAFEKARSRMLFKHLFFATLILSTPFIETKKYPRAATNMKVVYWNPDFFATLSVDVIMFVIAHEIFHILLKHGLRRGNRDHDRWNRACDYAINLQLKDYGFEIWSVKNALGQECGALIDERFRNMSAEQIYATFAQEETNHDETDEGDGGDDGDAGDDGDSDDNSSNPGKPGKTAGSQKQDGLGRDLTDDDLPNDPAQRALVENQIDQNIARAVTIARQAGKMPAGLDLLVEGIINPPQPWLALFLDYMTRFTDSEESWSRRNRRITDFILPSRRNPGMGPIGVIGDTSASMFEYRIFAQVGEELTAIAQTVKPEFVQVIWADYAEASHEERFEPYDQIILHPRGGGGTDMRLSLAYIEKYDCDVVILITDAETPWPDQPTPYPLIILTTTGQPTPSWATTIRIR